MEAALQATPTTNADEAATPRKKVQADDTK
jgi:hypothetical protein